MERYDMPQTIQPSHWVPLTPAQLDFWEEFTFHPISRSQLSPIV